MLHKFILLKQIHDPIVREIVIDESCLVDEIRDFFEENAVEDLIKCITEYNKILNKIEKLHVSYKQKHKELQCVMHDYAIKYEPSYVVLLFNIKAYIEAIKIERRKLYAFSNYSTSNESVHIISPDTIIDLPSETKICSTSNLSNQLSSDGLIGSASNEPTHSLVYGLNHSFPNALTDSSSNSVIHSKSNVFIKSPTNVNDYQNIKSICLLHFLKLINDHQYTTFYDTGIGDFGVITITYNDIHQNGNLAAKLIYFSNCLYNVSESNLESKYNIIHSSCCWSVVLMFLGLLFVLNDNLYYKLYSEITV